MSDVNATLPEVTITATPIVDQTTSPAMSNTATPFAAVSCSIEVYMFEGSVYTITGGQIRSVTFSKPLHDGAVGTAEIQLAPGGPHGVESTPTWTEIITPMSHVLIGMTRGNRSAVVLDGVVIRIVEAQEWQTTDQVSTAGRVIMLECADFAWFFRNFNWYALTFLGMTAGTVANLDYAPANIPYLIDQGLIGGTGPSGEGGALNPINVAEKWYTKVMAGQNAILGQTFVPYQTNGRISFFNMVGTSWEAFPNAYIPYTDYFLAAEQTWMEKFLAILPFPWYEFFVTTAPSGAYSLVQGANGMTASGSVFSMATEPLAKAAGPQLVARVNPTPTMSFMGASTSQAATIGTLDMSRWNALSIGVPDAGFYTSDIDFDAESAFNFYTLNPTAYLSNFDGNASNILWNFYFGGAVDVASVHRYGFRPAIGTFRWFFDPQGTTQQMPDVDIPASAATMLAKYTSWFHPQPLMAKATCMWPLMPDILIGTRFRYAPFKDGLPWDFYVEAVRHSFVFGGPSTTTLTLTRGLPMSVYADASSDGVLQGVFSGNAMRQNGIYTTGVPSGTGPALTPFNPNDNVTQLWGRLANIFVMPQAPGN